MSKISIQNYRHNRHVVKQRQLKWMDKKQKLKTDAIDIVGYATSDKCLHCIATEFENTQIKK